MEYRTNLRPGKVYKLLISYNTPNSRLFLLNSFDFIFSLRDSENQPLEHENDDSCPDDFILKNCKF